MIEKYELNSKIIPILLDIAQEENIPVNIEIGERFKNATGDTMVDVILDYDEEHVEVVSEVIAKSINIAFDIIPETDE